MVDQDAFFSSVIKFNLHISLFYCQRKPDYPFSCSQRIWGRNCYFCVTMSYMTFNKKSILQLIFLIKYNEKVLFPLFSTRRHHFLHFIFSRSGLVQLFPISSGDCFGISFLFQYGIYKQALHLGWSRRAAGNFWGLCCFICPILCFLQG